MVILSCKYTLYKKDLNDISLKFKDQIFHFVFSNYSSGFFIGLCGDENLSSINYDIVNRSKYQSDIRAGVSINFKT